MKLQLKIPKLACSSCVSTLTKAVKSVDYNAVVQADAKTKVISVETQASKTEIEEAIAAVGYPAD